MGKEFKNWKEIEAFLKAQIADSLANDVAEDSKQLLKEKKQTEVYDAYTPYSTDGTTPYYQRSYRLLESNESKMIDDSTLEITSPRGTDEETGLDIASVVESGKGYTWGYTRDLNQEIGARPFMAATAEELRSGRARESLKKALQKRLGKDAVV